MLQPCISDGGPPASRLELSSQEPFFYREIGYPVSALWRCVDVNSPVHLPSHIAVIYRRFSLDAAKTPCACVSDQLAPLPAASVSLLMVERECILFARALNEAKGAPCCPRAARTPTILIIPYRS